MVSSIRFPSIRTYLPPLNLPMKIALGTLVLSSQFAQTQTKRILDPNRITVDDSKSNVVYYSLVVLSGLNLLFFLQYICLSHRRRLR
ncbi:MAG TPA: hypothetical protein VLG44_06710 [Chlamydiales bacterium]|nr:hypothetical protein [Chlamydiales bacterium]